MKAHRSPAIGWNSVGPEGIPLGEDADHGNAALAERLPAAPSAVPFLDEMEAAFGEDFSGVTALLGAGDALDGIGAEAAAEGEVIAFASPAPRREQVAHELTHVVQARAHGPAAGGVSAGSDAAEQQAEIVASAVTRDEPVALAAPAQPTAGVHRDRAPAAKAPDPDDLPASEAERKRARDAVRYWHREQVAYTGAMADYNTLNWNHYLSRTGGNQILDWTDGQYLNVLINATGAAAGLLAPAAVGAAIGSAIAPGPGTIIGAVVGFLVSTIWGAISVATSNDATNQAVHTAKKDQGEQVAGKIRDFANERSLAIQHADQIQEHATTVIDDPTQEKFVVDRWTRTMRAAQDELPKPPSRSDLTLASEMLREWVLQHAGTPTDENDETNGAAWEEARIDAFYDDVNGTTVIGHADLFSKQARYAWSRFGLDTTHADTVERKAAGMSAEGAKRAFDGQVTSWGRSTDEVALATSAVKSSDELRKDQRDQAQMLIVMGGWHLAAGYDLETADNSCYLDGLDWAIRLEAPESWGLPSVLTWSTSPT
ncbi:MAG: DUF4157 domain-containing protein [Myxococcota bacterium]